MAALSARAGLCGVLSSRLGGWLYNVIYEPWSARERAAPDAAEWGRFTAAEVGFRYWPWGTLWLGIHKTAGLVMFAVERGLVMMD